MTAASARVKEAAGRNTMPASEEMPEMMPLDRALTTYGCIQAGVSDSSANPEVS